MLDTLLNVISVEEKSDSAPLQEMRRAAISRQQYYQVSEVFKDLESSQEIAGQNQARRIILGY